MCLAVPAQLISINEAIGTVELTGATRDCSLLLVPDAKVGDWLLVHAGFAVQIVDEEEAKATLEPSGSWKNLKKLTCRKNRKQLDDIYYAVLANYIHLANGCDLWKFVVHIQSLFLEKGYDNYCHRE